MKLVRSVFDTWRDEYANRAEIDMCSASIKPLTMYELVEMCDEETKKRIYEFNNLPLSYPSIEENNALKKEIASL